MIDHNIMRLHISVHYTLRVAEIERLQTAHQQFGPND